MYSTKFPVLKFELPDTLGAKRMNACPTCPTSLARLGGVFGAFQGVKGSTLNRTPLEQPAGFRRFKRQSRQTLYNHATSTDPTKSVLLLRASADLFVNKTIPYTEIVEVSSDPSLRLLSTAMKLSLFSKVDYLQTTCYLSPIATSRGYCVCGEAVLASWNDATDKPTLICNAWRHSGPACVSSCHAYPG